MQNFQFSGFNLHHPLYLYTTLLIVTKLAANTIKPVTIAQD